MGDHVVLDVERLTSSADSCSSEEYHYQVVASSRALQSCPSSGGEHVVVLPVDEHGFVIQDKDPSSASTGIIVECRICQEEDDVGNLEVPCACSGSVKYAHRKCVQRWCNEKGDTICEICQKPYQHGYTAPPRAAQAEGIPIDLSGNWGITGPQLDLRDPRLLAMAAERHFLDSDYDEYASANASSAACCRSAALILMALLLLRHALAMASSGADDDSSTLFTLFLLRAAGFLLPCYIMLKALSILQRRRQRQEATMAEVAILIQAGQARGVQFAAAAPQIATTTTTILPSIPSAAAALAAATGSGSSSAEANSAAAAPTAAASAS